MTLIACHVAERGHSIVVIADRAFYLDGGTWIGQSWTPKIVQVAQNAVIACAGQDLGGRFVTKLSVLVERDETVQPEELYDASLVAFRELRKEYVAQRHFAPYNVCAIEEIDDLDDVKKDEILSDVHGSTMSFTVILACHMSTSSLLVASIGDDGEGSDASQFGRITTGTGKTLYNSEMAGIPDLNSLDTEQTIRAMYIGKKSAEKSSAVSKETDITVLRMGKVNYLSNGELAILEDEWQRYQATVLQARAEFLQRR